MLWESRLNVKLKTSRFNNRLMLQGSASSVSKAQVRRLLDTQALVCSPVVQVPSEDPFMRARVRTPDLIRRRYSFSTVF